MKEHRLAAILFSDLAGYTRLMGEDQENALNILSRARQIHIDRIKARKGISVEPGSGKCIKAEITLSDTLLNHKIWKELILSHA